MSEARNLSGGEPKSCSSELDSGCAGAPALTLIGVNLLVGPAPAVFAHTTMRMAWLESDDFVQDQARGADIPQNEWCPRDIEKHGGEISLRGRLLGEENDRTLS